MSVEIQGTCMTCGETYSSVFPHDCYTKRIDRAYVRLLHFLNILGVIGQWHIEPINDRFKDRSYVKFNVADKTNVYHQ